MVAVSGHFPPPFYTVFPLQFQPTSTSIIHFNSMRAHSSTCMFLFVFVFFVVIFFHFAIIFFLTINRIPQTNKQTSLSVRTPRLERGESWEAM